MAPSLICSFVMCRTVILAQCSNHQDQEDVARLALNLLETLDRSMRRITYEHGDGYTFNYLIDSGFTYCVVADEDIGREIPLAFLNQVRKDFLGKYRAQFVKALIADSLSNELGSKLKQHMEYVAAKVSKDEQVAMEYIDKNRGWRIRRKSKAPSLSYSFVAHGTVVLADWLQFDHTVSGMAVDYLSELPCSINKITYDRGGCTINYLLDSNFTYCAVAAKAMGRKIPLAFLDQIKKDFTARFGGGLAVATVQNSLNKDFRSKLKECMRHAEVKAAQASKDKGVTMENIEKDDEDDDDDDEDNDKEEDDDGDDEEDEY
ncbi:hypothetical protein ACFX1S_043844 [Malus domestica]